MTALFTNIVTGFLILLGLFSLGENLPFAALYTFFAFLGLGASYWQLKTRPVPRLRTIINIIFFLLTLNAILPFFTLKIKHDMFTMLINTWVYLLVLSTFIICGRRDYYITQGLALGLIIYACFYATNNPLALLGYSTGFLALWITALRSINLLPDEKSGEKITGGTMDVYREIKLGAMLFFAVLIIALPFYFLVPRFDIPLLPLDRILRQRYSAIYSDFPKRGLVAFLSKNPKDIMTDATKQGGKTPGPGGSQPQLDRKSVV